MKIIRLVRKPHYWFSHDAAHVFLPLFSQVFDSFVILASFVVDIIFMKGLAVYTIHEFVYILAFMLPWRVIRVTNSKYVYSNTKFTYHCLKY